MSSHVTIVIVRLSNGALPSTTSLRPQMWSWSVTDSSTMTDPISLTKRVRTNHSLIPSRTRKHCASTSHSLRKHFQTSPVFNHHPSPAHTLSYCRNQGSEPDPYQLALKLGLLGLLGLLQEVVHPCSRPVLCCSLRYVTCTRRTQST